MARIESLAYAQGASDQTFMENAGAAIAACVEEFVANNELPKIITLLVGKGNNGGDAFVAGERLLERGFQVAAQHIYPLEECSALCKKMSEKFRARGGKVNHEEVVLRGILLDGLVGTGFRGKADGILAKTIEKANRSGLPILAIDIPSGLNGTTGEVESVAIQATETIFLGLPKAGFFLKEGWNYVGELRKADFGLSDRHFAEAKPLAYLLNEEIIADLLPPIKRTRHKYQAGYVLAVAGSPGMPGAAILSSYAALRSGAGIVRLFHPAGMEAELSSAPFELIREGLESKRLSRIRQEASRAKAMLIGPGMGRTKETKKLFQRILNAIDLPMVIDADALFLLAGLSSWKLPKGSILTPHHGEMQMLLTGFSEKSKEEKNYLELCQMYAQEKEVTLVLKGAPTIIFHPGASPLIVTRGDPGMATAGSGDVLTGIIAAMVAQGLEARNAAALAVFLHGYAGECAALNLTSYCMTSSDLIDFLPESFATFL
ncbi:MAG: NAD(P)H-hydrate dehydratase [Candidatus Melainabacteria bacterium]|nr:NAD(P)H-hydrate dehydratase [Candidatus Melainabacteria bacterium]